MKLLELISSCLWGAFTVAAVLICEIFISVMCGFPQIHIKQWIGHTIGSAFKKNDGKRKNTNGVSPFQTATAALAGTIGTGNIVGVAAALMLGGPPSVLWMWAAATVAMGVSYAENRLGVEYRARDEKGGMLGGPMLYISNGLNIRRLAAVWAIICMISAFGVGNITQVNSIAASAYNAFRCPRWLSGILICCCAAPSVLGGVSRMVKLTEKLVPFMAGAYIIACITVIIKNANMLPHAFEMIFSGILSPRSACGGITAGMLVGVRRGVFTNEAGMGSSVILNASADSSDPHTAGCWGMFEVFTDTIIMCTLTALALLTSGAYERIAPNGIMTSGADSIAMSSAAFEDIFGRYSGVFIALCLLLFAFSTVVSWSAIGERAFCWLFGAKYSKYYRLAYVIFVIPGAVLNVDAVWAAADIINACMLLPNMAAVTAILISEYKHSNERVRLVEVLSKSPKSAKA